jgi:hypothetical protein
VFDILDISIVRVFTRLFKFAVSTVDVIKLRMIREDGNELRVEMV